MLLSVLEIISSTGDAASLLTAMVGAITALLVFGAVKKWFGLDRFQKHPAWSFVQPFEE